ncbi:MAG TPA: DUF4232 domain-containing protein [Acidimicrobiales bacterium]|nr:DUF4232 domain-containing protein [Acidimicrobiales bacterium]
MTRPVWSLAVLAGAGLCLAACSNSPSPKHSTTTTTHHATTSSSSTTSTSSASTTSSTAAGSAACSHISAAAGQSQGAAGTITGVVTVTNTGTTPCTVDGYPTMGLYSGSGAPLTVTIVNGLTVSVTPQASAPPSSVTIAPSSTAQFAYQISDVPVGSETSCPMSEQATTTMPGASASSPYFPLAIAPCNNGTIRVSPVYKTA